MKKILCIDFDGTITKHDFPEISDEMPYAIAVIKALKAAGHKLILWTAREDGNWQSKHRNYLTEAVNWCKERGIEFDAVNTTLPNDDWRDEHTLKRKPHADYFIDDRNIGGFLGWEKIGRILLSDEEMDKIIADSKSKDQTLGLHGIESQYKSWGDTE
jgi:hypothetical protein